MFNILLFLLSPFLAIAGVGNVISTPASQSQDTNVSFATNGSCWNPEPPETLTITTAMLDPVHAQFPTTRACYGTGEFNGLQGVLGGYTLVRRDTHLVRFKTDVEGGPFYGGCDVTGSAIRWIGALPDGRKIWWADSSYKNGMLDGLVYIETSEGEKDRVFDIYAHDRWIDSPPGHILECNLTGGVVPVLEEDADLLPPQVVSFTNETEYTKSGRRPYLDISGYESNYGQFAILPNVTQAPGTIGPTIPASSVLFPPTTHYLIKIEEADQTLPKKALNKGRIGTVRGTTGAGKYEYEVYFHAGEFYLRDPKDNVLFIYEASFDAPGGDINSNPSLQLGVLNFRVANEWSPYTPTCKPAIYLYPEKPIDLSVQIVPDGYLTASTPSYNGGWNVRANPDGIIEQCKNSGMQECNNYPYLYYEAQIRNLSIPKEGWVVKREELSGFFDEKLERLGLNSKEIADFKEYWVAKLSANPYYFVTLISKNELDKKETLLFSKTPDTLIRVRMIFEGLTSPVSVVPLLLPQTPKRAGFTAVDWGGGEVGGNCAGGVVKEVTVQ